MLCIFLNGDNQYLQWLIGKISKVIKFIDAAVAVPLLKASKCYLEVHLHVRCVVHWSIPKMGKDISMSL